MNGSMVESGDRQPWPVRTGVKPAPTHEVSTAFSLFVHDHDKGHLLHGSNLAFPRPHILHGHLRLPPPDRLKGPEFLSPPGCPVATSLYWERTNLTIASSSGLTNCH
jgi:hypothetical protein